MGSKVEQSLSYYIEYYNQVKEIINETLRSSKTKRWVIYITLLTFWISNQCTIAFKKTILSERDWTNQYIILNMVDVEV